MTLGCLWTRRAAEIYHEEGPGRSVCNMGQRGRANAFLPLKGLFSALRHRKVAEPHVQRRSRAKRLQAPVFSRDLYRHQCCSNASVPEAEA